MPRIRVLAGPSPTSLSPITANDGRGHPIKSSSFEGEISVFLKDFVNEKGQVPHTDYFNHESRTGCTWSIQARGRFLKELSTDDVLFGNVFDRALNLPYGSGAAVKFMHFADATLEDDLKCEKPWALSPLITTMPYISVQKYTPGSNSNSNTKSPRIIGDDTEILTPFSEAPVRDDRRTHFREAANRKNTKFTPDHYVECDFCHGMLSFAGDGLAVSFPMVSFDLMKYWDGRPVWFVCCERDKGGSGPGEMIWCVGFEIIEGEDVPQQDESKGVQNGTAQPKPAAAAGNDISGDVD